MHQETSGQSERPEGGGINSQHAAKVMDVLEEAVALFFRLRAVLEDIHGNSEISGSMRGVMRDLKANGPLTVPQMARRRPVSRQHIQAIVNDLLRASLVELRENPRHKRSRIVQLTSDGETALQDIVDREQAVLREIEMPVSEADLNHAHDVMISLREMMEGREWRETVRTVLYQDGETPDNPWIDESEDFRDSSSGSVHQN
jgi:DNA-binding MarR family transcriptional regulator